MPAKAPQRQNVALGVLARVDHGQSVRLAFITVACAVAARAGRGFVGYVHHVGVALMIEMGQHRASFK